MKKMMVLILLLLSIVILYFSFSYVFYLRKISDYQKKTHMGICSDNQGMVTYDIILNADSTFYTEILGEYYFGEYYRAGGKIFFTNAEEIGICDVYILSHTNILLPRKNSHYEQLIFEKIK